ncbi:MAG: hypothetical protein PWR20_2503 [Bacteroidales bacterium]|nr:hypothetical protein [Bacteroidales bacterium]MDN5330426.1 hypothetical protein [Bacteroidales bacterium]
MMLFKPKVVKVRQPTFFFFVILLLFIDHPSLFGQAKTQNQPYSVLVEGRIDIEAFSNLGAITLRSDFRRHLAFDSSINEFSLNLPVKQFRSHLPGIAADFRKLLKADIYPEIIINIPYPALKSLANFNNAGVLITDRFIRINHELMKRRDDQSFVFEQSLSLDELGVYHGEKIRGVITLKDTIKVRLALSFLEQ